MAIIEPPMTRFQTVLAFLRMHGAEVHSSDPMVLWISFSGPEELPEKLTAFLPGLDYAIHTVGTDPGCAQWRYVLLTEKRTLHWFRVTPGPGVTFRQLATSAEELLAELLHDQPNSGIILGHITLGAP